MSGNVLNYETEIKRKLFVTSESEMVNVNFGDLEKSI